MLGFFIGGLIGITAGFFRGRYERTVMAVMDVMLSFPSLILALALIAALSLVISPWAAEMAGQYAKRLEARDDVSRVTPGVFGEVADATVWHGHPPARFTRFVGRAEVLWELDSALRPASFGSGGARAPEGDRQPGHIRRRTVE